MADPRPQDAWIEGGAAFVVFALRPAVEGVVNSPGDPPSQVLFVLRALSRTLVAARLMEPAGSGEWRVQNLLGAEGGEGEPVDNDMQPPAR